MGRKTVLGLKQGGTYTVPFSVEEDGVVDFTGWKVYFIVKKDLSTSNADAIINETIDIDSVTGAGSFILSDEETAQMTVGSYIYGAKVVDSDGNVAHTDVGTFIVEAVAYEGATA